MYVPVLEFKKTKNLKIFSGLGILVVILFFLIIRPIYVKSTCSSVATLRARDSYGSLYDDYLKTNSSPTYKGYNKFLENASENKNPKLENDFSDKDYTFNYGRCLHQYGE